MSGSNQKKVSSFTPRIGLEIHIQPDSRTKAFCGCPADPLRPPNQNICPVCAGLPGGLPVPNKTLPEKAIRLGLALQSKIAHVLAFDRKHYFYPDLPKGYQITQKRIPLCSGGMLKTLKGNCWNIQEIHIEEDSGRSIHHEPYLPENRTAIDLNRAGMPLIEMVTPPVFQSGAEVTDFLQELQKLLRILLIGECVMAKGQLRCDINISLAGGESREDRVEIKNLNSFRQIRDAIDWETERQELILSSGGTVKRQTKNWDTKSRACVTIRSKETNKDYRFMPEPDIPEMDITDKYIEQLRATLPATPQKLVADLSREYRLSGEQASALIDRPDLLTLFKSAFSSGGGALLYRLLIVRLPAVLSECGAEVDDLSSDDLRYIAEQSQRRNLNGRQVDALLKHAITDSEPVREVLKGWSRQRTNPDELERLASEAIRENPDAVRDYRAGKSNAINFLVGCMMKMMPNKTDPAEIMRMLKQKLEVP